MAKASKRRPDEVRAVLALPTGPFTWKRLDTRRAPIGPHGKKAAARAATDLEARLAELQERLFAQGQGGDRRRVLLLLQGMDTAGKDGVINHVVGAMNPGGIHLASFKQPTAQERAHPFLWRIERQVPGPGVVGVFNRSQYEDVLVVRVHDLVPEAEWQQRYAAINDFEQRLAAEGVVIVKCFLHVSRKVQRRRLAARLTDPRKYWKYNPADLTERGFWSSYREAYAAVLERCDTPAAPWYVIPADRKWYRNWAVAALLVEVLTELDPRFPPPAFDVAAERARVARS